MFCAGDEHFLVLDAHPFCAGGDEHFSAGDEHVKNARSNFSHTHKASYQRLPNRTYMYIELTFEKARYHAGEINSMALPWVLRWSPLWLLLSSPNKKKNISTNSTKSSSVEAIHWQCFDYLAVFLTSLFGIINGINHAHPMWKFTMEISYISIQFLGLNIQ